MDEESARMYSNPEVVVIGYEGHEQEIQSVSKFIFGRSLAPDELVDFIGAPSGSSVQFEVCDDNGDLALRIYCDYFEEPHEYIVYVELQTGKRIVFAENIHHKNDAPDGLATRIMARQVRKFQKYGINEIRVFADGHLGGSNGYYTWARLGYVLYLNGYGAQLQAAGLTPVDTTIELFQQEGGRAW